MRSFKNILITGGAGFIGSTFIRKCLFDQQNKPTGFLQKDAKIICIDCETYAAVSKTQDSFINHPAYTFYKADITNKIHCEEIILNHKPDYIINIAAETHVDRSITNPDAFITSNILGTVNLLEIAQKLIDQRDNPNFLFHQVSTDEVFGSLHLHENAFEETSPYRPRSPYAASKASGDHLVHAWQHTYGLPVVITHCGNNYGPFQYPEKLIPITIINALLGRSINIYNKGDNIRDWIYVGDHVEALQTTALKGEPGESYLIGGNNEQSNLSVVTLICTMLDQLAPDNNGPYSRLITFVPDRAGHDFRYANNCQKIKQNLGWKPSTDFKAGLHKTISWYLQNRDWWKDIILQ